MGTVSIDGTRIKLPVQTEDPTTIEQGEIHNVNDVLKLAVGSSPVLKAILDEDHDVATGVHGVGSGYICKTSRSDQKPSWGDIPDKPSEFPPESHTHYKGDIVDFAHDHSGDTLNPAEINVGDIKFKNGWILTEHDKHGLVLVSPEGRKYAFTLRLVD